MTAEHEGRTWRIVLDLGNGSLGALQRHIDPADLAAVAEQLGRPARGVLEIASRCPSGHPNVVKTEPRLPDGTPFPTLFYITCPRLAGAIGTLEAAGLMAEMSQRLTEDDVLESTLDAGAEDVNDHGDSFRVLSEATDVVAVRTSLQTAGIDYDSADVEFVPSMEIPVDKDAAVKVLHLADALEDLDDVQNVFTNVDIPDDVLAELDQDDD